MELLCAPTPALECRRLRGESLISDERDQRVWRNRRSQKIRFAQHKPITSIGGIDTFPTLCGNAYTCMPVMKAHSLCRSGWKDWEGMRLSRFEISLDRLCHAKAGMIGVIHF